MATARKATTIADTTATPASKRGRHELGEAKKKAKEGEREAPREGACAMWLPRKDRFCRMARHPGLSQLNADFSRERLRVLVLFLSPSSSLPLFLFCIGLAIRACLSFTNSSELYACVIVYYTYLSRKALPAVESAFVVAGSRPSPFPPFFPIFSFPFLLLSRDWALSCFMEMKSLLYVSCHGC